MAGSREQPEAVYVVRAYVVNRSTGARTSESIVGIFEDRAGAESLVEAFNQQAFERRRSTDQEEARAHLVRYGMPYTAPAVKELMEVT